MKLVILSLFIVLGISKLYSQETKKIVIKNKNSFFVEEYYVLSSDRTIKHGMYLKKTTKNKIKEEGNFSNNLKDSIWIYYNSNGKDTLSVRHFKNGNPIGKLILYNDKGDIYCIYDYHSNKVLKYNWGDTPNKFPILINNKWIEDSIDSPPLIVSGEDPRSKLAKIIRYPEQSAINGISGEVIVAYTIDQKGNMSNLRIKESVDPLLDAEAMRAMSNIIDTRFFPAIKNGVPVTIEYFMPVNFVLN